MRKIAVLCLMIICQFFVIDSLQVTGDESQLTPTGLIFSEEYNKATQSFLDVLKETVETEIEKIDNEVTEHLPAQQETFVEDYALLPTQPSVEHNDSQEYEKGSQLCHFKICNLG